jgi:PAS domain S-box-containing protein
MVLLTPMGEVLEVNNRVAALSGEQPGEFVGLPLWNVSPVRSLPESQAALRELVEGAARGEAATREVELMIGGERRQAVMSVTPVIGRDGSVDYLVAEGHDISELRVAQEQLRQSQKMEALGQLTGGIAHDFNNLLTVVVGGLDLIVKRAADPKLERYARNALEAAERGARLTAQLLAFSRVQRLEVRPTLVAPLVEQMRPLLANVLGPKIEKLFQLDAELTPVLADPTQLELAVLNLAINARDAMPEGGRLTIVTRQVAVTNDPELEPGDYVELCISDTGTGMPPDVARRAFEPFFTTKEVGRGTGLGLSMVYGVARQSGGTARIESAEGEGTTVRLTFRRAAGEGTPDAGASAANDDRPLGGGTASVLVVDDDPDVRGFIAASLEDLGYHVLEAEDGARALELFGANAPDLVVLDFLMPGLSGAEVARALRKERPGQPILFVSGYSETDAIRAAAPDAVLLPKPFRADALGKAVREVLATG